MPEMPKVELRGICKRFGEVKANENVDLCVWPGEIHAILGENGSGKSTLMNILSGIYAPDDGEILLEGKPVVLRSPKDAIDLRIGMIHQHFKLIGAQTAWENIVGGIRGGLLLSRRKVIAQVRELCERYSLPLDPTKRVADMTIGEKQTVEILKALYRGADILILDEPTAVLTVQEISRLFDILRRMRAAGNAVIIITHKLNEVMEISDRVTVLRKGQSIASLPSKGISAEELAEWMVGRRVEITVPFVETPEESKRMVLRIRNLKLKRTSGKTRLDVKELDLRSSEIVGVAGVSDSGQRELCEAIMGLRRVSGSIRLYDTELVGLDPRRMLKKNVEIGFVPEDRLGMGLAGGLSITENVMLRSYRKMRGIWMDRRWGRNQAKRIMRDYDVAASGPDQTVRSLSGGNIQKILLGREIEFGSDLLIAAYPVRGLDIGATDFIYARLNEIKQRDCAILLIAEDLDTLLGICDRICVMHSGHMVAVLDARSATKEELGLLMTGVKKGV